MSDQRQNKATSFGDLAKLIVDRVEIVDPPRCHIIEEHLGIDTSQEPSDDDRKAEA